MLFRRNKVKRDKTRLLKEVKANTKREFNEIGKIGEPAERVTRYEALLNKLWGFYTGGKPETMDRAGATIGALSGGALGFCVAGLTLSLAAPYIAVPIGLGILGGSALAGGTGVSRWLGTMFNREERKDLRAEYGSLRNARRMYRMEKMIEKELEKDRNTIRSLAHNAQLREQFEKTYRKEEPAKAEPAAAPETPRTQTHQPTI